MKFIADLHIHSKYSRATSKDMDVDHIAEWAKLKGIGLVATGDFTHPIWLSELKSKLKQDSKGLYEYKGVKFMLTAEVSNMYTKNGKGRRIHTLLFAPDFDTVDKINGKLADIGNVVSDGRPIFGFDVKDIVKICLDASENCMVVPAHAWTPWFSVFGSKSGFDSVEECFEEEAGNIYALETGLSSDPAMNWRVSSLDKYSLISNSDAHSPSKLGREVNVFNTELSYSAIVQALKEKDKSKFLFTVEFFPEEGKYHFDGHRDCGIRFSPTETKAHNNRCPKCNRPLTVGVMNRVDELSDRKEGFMPEDAIGFKRLVPLVEIIAEAKQKGPMTKAVAEEYRKAIASFGSEFEILLDAEEKELSSHLPERVAQAIIKVRNGELVIEPGYDGVFGTVKIFKEEELKEAQSAQLELF
ncbi:MAG: DNA helicase UvrD [Candidatus Omnitrophica bacterium]|nr:DNA helicase UvrD [Candidatus Omnitrophota bacterium]